MFFTSSILCNTKFKLIILNFRNDRLLLLILKHFPKIDPQLITLIHPLPVFPDRKLSMVPPTNSPKILPRLPPEITCLPNCPYRKINHLNNLFI